MRGPAVFAGYHRNPEANAKALRGGWFHTGDLGRLDAAGFLYITGRASDMYISGGSNVYPREAEEVLLTHPAVADGRSAGSARPQCGANPASRWRVLAPGAAADEAELLGYLEGKLGQVQVAAPRLLLGRACRNSGYGKIPKHLIREEALRARRGAGGVRGHERADPSRRARAAASPAAARGDGGAACACACPPAPTS